jgi:hypothetical protein
MKIICKECGQTILAHDVDLSTGLARCLECNSVFDLLHDLGLGAKPKAEQAALATIGSFPLPAGTTIEETSFDLRIFCSWFNPNYVLLSFFCLAWDSLLLSWYVVATSLKNAPVVLFGFPLAHLAIAVALTYVTLAGLFNRTTVTANGQFLRVQHGPLPWLGGYRWAVNSIRQLYILRSQEGSRDRYGLGALLNNGRRGLLISGLETREYAAFIGKKIETYLGLRHGNIAGEIPQRTTSSLDASPLGLAGIPDGTARETV